jgi:putative addiction module component (TIGR02574 family)
MSIDEIKQLDISECILLVEEIWDSIAQEQEQD